MRLAFSADGNTEECVLSGISILTQRPLQGFEGAKKIQCELEFYLPMMTDNATIIITMSRDEAANFARRLLATAGQDESPNQHPTAKAYE